MARWIINGTTMTYNPTWRGGDSGWNAEGRITKLDPLGSSTTVIQAEPPRSPERQLVFEWQTAAVKDAVDATWRAGAAVAMTDDTGTSFTGLITAFKCQRTPKVQDYSLYRVEISVMQR